VTAPSRSLPSSAAGIWDSGYQSQFNYRIVNGIFIPEKFDNDPAWVDFMKIQEARGSQNVLLDDKINLRTTSPSAAKTQKMRAERDSKTGKWSTSKTGGVKSERFSAQKEGEGTVTLWNADIYSGKGTLVQGISDNEGALQYNTGVHWQGDVRTRARLLQKGLGKPAGFEAEAIGYIESEYVRISVKESDGFAENSELYGRLDATVRSVGELNAKIRTEVGAGQLNLEGGLNGEIVLLQIAGEFDGGVKLFDDSLGIRLRAWGAGNAGGLGLALGGKFTAGRGKLSLGLDMGATAMFGLRGKVAVDVDATKLVDATFSYIDSEVQSASSYIDNQAKYFGSMWDNFWGN
jgi:hypothetical protein